jgi:hypothetical protein
VAGCASGFDATIDVLGSGRPAPVWPRSGRVQ